MKRVIVRNRQGVETHGAVLQNPTDWVAEQLALNSFGKPDRWVTKASGETIPPDAAVRIQQNPITGAEVEEYFLPAEYTVEVTDITAEVTAEKAKATNREKMKSRILEIVAKDVLNAAEVSEGFDLLARYVFLQDAKVPKPK